MCYLMSLQAGNGSDPYLMVTSPGEEEGAATQAFRPLGRSTTEPEAPPLGALHMASAGTSVLLITEIATMITASSTLLYFNCSSYNFKFGASFAACDSDLSSSTWAVLPQSPRSEVNQVASSQASVGAQPVSHSVAAGAVSHVRFQPGISVTCFGVIRVMLLTHVQPLSN